MTSLTYPHIQPGLEFGFTSPYDQHADRIGQLATVISQVDPKTYDYDECGPLYLVRFADGTEIEAWPEEIDSELMK